MSAIDKLYTEWAWRTKTGTPNMKDPKDKAILDRLISELSVPGVIAEIAPQYDSYLMDNGFPVIPQAKGKYSQPQGSGDMKVHSDDLATYQKMFTMNAGDQTVGPGELALYWLYQYQKNPINCSDNRGGSEPDLTIGSVKAEVKAYKSHNGKITLGKFGSQKTNLVLLTVVFGIQALSSVLNMESEAKVVRPTSFTKDELIRAFEFYFKVKNAPGFLAAASQFDFIRSLKEKIDMVDRVLQNPKSPEEAASKTLGRIAKEKFKVKPGFGNYIASTLKNGDIHFFHVTEEALDVNLLDHVSISAGEVKVDYMALFG